MTTRSTSLPRTGPPPRRRSLLAATAGIALAAGGLAPIAAAPAATAIAAGAAGAVPTAGLQAEYVFDETTGSSVPNSATTAVGAATVMNPAADQWTGTSLKLSGGAKTSPTANWVRLPDNLLSGKTSATVTIETRLDVTMKSSWNFLWNIGSESTTQYFFASVRDNPRTSITAAGGGGEANARSSTALEADRWYSLTSVIDGEADRVSFYVDGDLVASTATALSPAAITDQTLNAIGRAPYPDPTYKGEVSTFRVYDRALAPAEVEQVSDADAAIHADAHRAAARAVLDAVEPVTIDEGTATLPDYGGRVTWSSADASLTVDGTTVTTTQPATGAAPRAAELTASASVRGTTATRSVAATVNPVPAADDPFGYAMVHFVEDSAGYAEKIYLDVSRGNDPEAWDRLNGGEPILASHLGTTGIRDPYLTYNPETETYFIIATDLRVFGGDRGSAGCTEWCYWSSQGSTLLNVWESKDLVTWGDLRQIEVATPPAGGTAPELGMAWAPEATWVDGYGPDGSGAFVVYWASNVYSSPAHTGSSYSRILWGSTTDFTQETYRYGGVFIDAGGNTIDTTIIQNEGKTYRITKDNSAGKGIYMESTPADRWWLPSATWTQIQTRIGAVWSGGNAGGVEGPAVFQRHGEEKWYLYVDVIPSIGYRPMETTDLDTGWSQLSSPRFSMAPSTKHGGIVPLSFAQYGTIRAGDAVEAKNTQLGAIEVPTGTTGADLAAALPSSAEVSLAYDRGTATLPVDWNVAAVDTSAPGTRTVTGTVRSIGANLNQWRGAEGSTAYNAPERTLFSSTAITVTAEVMVAAPPLPVTVTVSTRCVAGKVVVVPQVRNDGASAVALRLTTAFGSKSVSALQPGKTTSAAFTTRSGTATAGAVTAAVSAGGLSAETTADYPAVTCR